MSSTVRDQNAKSKKLVMPKARRRDNEIISVEAFPHILEYEQLRTDRSGIAFSLVLFASSDFAIKKQAKRLINRLRSQMRILDSIGWIDESVIGVLLPMTTEAQTERFVTKVLSAAGVAGFSIDVYEYPGNWPGDQLTFVRHPLATSPDQTVNKSSAAHDDRRSNESRF